MFRNETFAAALSTGNAGESSRLSLTMFGSSTNASFGAVSGEVAEVTQSAPAAGTLAATQFGGRAGAPTLSKFSEKSTWRAPVCMSNATVPRFVAPSWS